MRFLLLTPAYSAGSDSSDDKPAKPAHSKEYYKAVKLIKAGSFDEALVILETIIQKKPDDGNMKGLAFIKDPDGYWIEILSSKGLASTI